MNSSPTGESVLPHSGQTVVSGSHEDMEAAMQALAKAGIEATMLPVAAAFHSSLVKPARNALAAKIEATPWRETAIPVYSNANARPHSADVAATRRAMAYS